MEYHRYNQRGTICYWEDNYVIELNENVFLNIKNIK